MNNVTITKLQEMPIPTPQSYQDVGGIELFNPNFFDTGIIAHLEIPYNINKFAQVNNNNAITPLIGVRLTDRPNLDLANPTTSPLILPSSLWASSNTRITCHPNLDPHFNFFKSCTFLGWRGSISYLVMLTSNSVMQGSLTFTNFKTTNNGPFNSVIPQTHADDATSNVLVNLANDRLVMTTIDYTEQTPWCNEVAFSRRSMALEGLNPNVFRNFLVIRPNSDITTFSGQPSILQFKFFMSFGPDFEWMFPTCPLNWRSLVPRRSAIDPYLPFEYRVRLLVQNRNLVGGHSVDLEFEYQPNTAFRCDHLNHSYTLALSTTNLHYFAQYSTVPTAEWIEINEITFGFTSAVLEGFFVAVRPVNPAQAEFFLYNGLFSAMGGFATVLATIYASQNPVTPPFVND